MGPLKLFRLMTAALSLAVATATAATAAAPLQQITNDPAVDVRPTWSPDGKRVAFQSNRTGQYEIYVVDLNGGNEARISRGDNDDRHPAWSPDGKTIAVDSGSGGLREIWLLDIATGERTQVTRIGSIASFPSWSPDGKVLSFYLYRGGTLDLWVVGADGTSPSALVTGIASEQRQECTFACHSAAWSPDGGRIAYSSPSPPAVWTMRAADAGDRKQVSQPALAGTSHFPMYLSDGRLLYVTEHVTPGGSWTNVWAVGPGSGAPADALLQDIQAQGPFEFSPDGQQMLFASPRAGNFDLYLVQLNQEGQDVLKIKSAEAVPASGLTHPEMLAGGSNTDTRPLAPRAEPPGTPVATPPASDGATALQNAGPYLLALAVLGGIWISVEGATLWRRRRKRRLLDD